MVSMPDTSLPRSQPIKTFKDLLSWQPGHDDYNVAHTPFHPRPPTVSHTRASRNLNGDSPVDSFSPAPSSSSSIDCKVIVCHDMAGGYAEDALPQGNSYSTIYSIQYWNHVDTFIYFSHSRITIPPPVWINATHRNGVRCLGTIITEWLPGILETDEMVSGPGQTLADENGDDTVDRRWFSKTYADKLVDMAVYYQFDGWFINVESILRGGAQQANQTIAFLAYLRSQIHARIPGGELIWYDSVISSTGEVAWQDKLSPENYRFFEQSDGIFTNYTWKEKSVGESVALAGPRNRDVYTGVDVWGRNTYGGGGYTTYKALEVIQRERTSCALFAPAWTYESLGKENFMTNDRLFWSGYGGAGIHAESLPLSSFYDATCRLSEELGGKPHAIGEGDRVDNKGFLPVSAYIPARPSGTSSWFYSNFDRGFGKGFWVNGKRVSDKPWSHLSHQSLSPSMTKEIFVLSPDHLIQRPVLGDKVIRWILSPEEAYSGGTSLVVQEFSFTGLTPPPPTPPIPPPPSPLPPSSPSSSQEPALSSVDSTTHFGLKTILVPLFDTRISLLNAKNSTVELIFKSYQDDVQVGVHLGMLAMEIDKGRANTRTVCGISKQNLWNMLHPEIKEKWKTLGPGGSTSLVNRNLRGGSASLVMLDVGYTTNGLESASVIELPLEEGGFLYSLETLSDGWKRLTLHLSSLFDMHDWDNSGGEDNMDMSSIALSQLGIALTYERTFEWSQEGESRPLMLLGSFGVIPTWSVQYKGSCVLGLKSEDSVSIVTKRTVGDRDRDPVSLHEHRQQKLSVVGGPSWESNVIWIMLSSTVSWNIGFPIVGPSPTSKVELSATNGHPSSSEYSHYCIYLSVEKRKEASLIEAVRDKESGCGALVFVGTAFTNRYRISNFEMALEHSLSVPKDESDEFTDVKSSMQGQPTLAEILEQTGQDVWVWVQGIRRDGRADERQDWGKALLL